MLLRSERAADDEDSDEDDADYEEEASGLRTESGQNLVIEHLHCCVSET